MAKKIGGASNSGSKATAKGTDGKRERKAKPAFDVKTATDADGKAIPGRAEGKLQAVPANYEHGKMKPLKKSDFANDAVYAEFRADALDLKAAEYADKARKARADAKRLAAFGDEATRKKASKLLKHREALAALEAELQGDGFDLGLLDDGSADEGDSDEE